jgi:D-alanyl-D-alanine dipeptidase
MISLEHSGILIRPWATDMLPYTGTTIYVRESVFAKLVNINRYLLEKYGIKLVVTYGYRHPEIQQKYFNEILPKMRKKFLGELIEARLRYNTFSYGGPHSYSALPKIMLTDEELYAYVHNYIAVPNVAGHPTGGAVDVCLSQDGKLVDMGCVIADFESEIKTFSKKITDLQLANRLILRQAMMNENFAPFNGEWWHFSYGDKEWAFWYHHKESFYGQINFKLF